MIRSTGLVCEGLAVHVWDALPWKSENPSKPDDVHAVRCFGQLYVSEACFKALKNYAFRAKARAWFRRTEARG